MAIRVALVTFSTRPRGGCVHTLHLAEALERMNHPVHVFALGDPDQGFFRPTPVSFTIAQAPPSTGSLEEKVMRSVDVLADQLETALPGQFDVVHTEDCIAARAACRVRERHPELKVLRTVHHIDDFSTPALIECQDRSIVDPDHVLVVSRYWQRILEEQYQIDSVVVANGVDAARFRRPPGFDAGAFRAGVVGNRMTFLTVGGIEPRKGSMELFEALAQVKTRLTDPPALVVVGGHSFRDHSEYRDRALQLAKERGLEEGGDYFLVGTVSDADLVRWYHAADAFVFPSVNEGWGLAVLEAMAAGLPVLTTDIEVFREYLNDETALLVPPGDAPQLAEALIRLSGDPKLRNRLARAGPGVAGAFTWEASAAHHAGIYRALSGGLDPSARVARGSA